MKRYFISFSVIRSINKKVEDGNSIEYFQLFNQEVEVENGIQSLDDIYEIEEEIRESLIENDIIPKNDAYMYNINILFWRTFDGCKITAGI